MRGSTGSGWFFLLPDGSLNRWNGSFAGSEQLAMLGTQYYDDPMRLLESQPVDLTYSVQGNMLTVTPGVQGGTFHFLVSVNDGPAVASATFDVDVEVPQLEISIDDQIIESGTSAVFNLPTMSASGLSITYEFSIVDPLYELDQAHGFYSSGEYYTNYAGRNERWIRNASNEWHYLMPNGDLFHWAGNFDTNPRLGQLGSAVYNDPTLLTAAQPLPITIGYANGQLTVTPQSGFVGQFELRVTATDGVSSIVRVISIEVRPAGASLIDDAFSGWGGLAGA